MILTNALSLPLMPDSLVAIPVYERFQGCPVKPA